MFAQRKREARRKQKSTYIIGRDAKGAEQLKTLRAELQREEYLRSIGLGTAKPTQSSGMSWTKYAQEHGVQYTAPTSGVAEAERRAAETINANARKNAPFWTTTSTEPGLNFEYITA